jgi:hypothetical protein
MIGIIQKALWSGKVYGFWEPINKGVTAFGPFINRNHFAGWMLMALPLAVGYFAALVARGMVGVKPGWRNRETFTRWVGETADFIRSLDPDGVQHGVFGAERHGYFEASPNHDAIAFRVADDVQAERIYRKMASRPGLRPHDFILPNYPSYDDMYEEPKGLWAFGTWVNGGHWSTCEARMIMGYYRLGKHEDARRSMKKMLGLARRFRMDNPLVDFGNAPYQPNLPINCVYDNWGVPAAMCCPHRSQVYVIVLLMRHLLVVVGGI